MTAPLLSVRNLRTTFAARGARLAAVDGVSFDVYPGQTLGIVGESGSGKSVTQLSVLGLLPSPPATVEQGEAIFDGVDLLKLSPEALRKIRGNQIAMIFQDPMTSLHPLLKVRVQLTEVLAAHTNLSPAEQIERATEMMARVGIPDPRARLEAYPHQLSGGMRQRVMVAMALLCSPRLLIADEPTTALDVTVQRQILGVLRDLTEARGLALLLISHDLGVVAHLTQHLHVLYAGRTVECGPTGDLLSTPQHPYLRGLRAAMPSVGHIPVPIPGTLPAPNERGPGCRFAPRCPLADSACTQPPPLTAWGARHLACWRGAA